MIRTKPFTAEEQAVYEAEFKAYLARLRTIPQDLQRKWPEVHGADVELAWGRAIALPQKVDERAARRAERAVAKLNREPTFQAEVKRLVTLLGPAKPPPSPSDADYSFGAIGGWIASEDERRDILHRESRRFAVEHRFPYIAPDAVVVALGDAVDQGYQSSTWWPPRSAQLNNNGSPVIYVNPLPNTDVSAPVGPGRILVDLTNASYDDLTALAPVLAEVQERLGYTKQRGRQYEGNAEQMAFVHQLRTSTSGRGRKWTWKQIRDKFHKKFGENVAEATLKQRYAAWQRWNESTE